MSCLVYTDNFLHVSIFICHIKKLTRQFFSKNNCHTKIVTISIGVIIGICDSVSICVSIGDSISTCIVIYISTGDSFSIILSHPSLFHLMLII